MSNTVNLSGKSPTEQLNALKNASEKLNGNFSNFKAIEGVNLTGQVIDFSLNGIKMPGAILRGTRFIKPASLECADFSDADLTNARAKSVNMAGINLTNAVLDNADLSQQTLDNRSIARGSSPPPPTNLDGAILDGASLKNAKLNGARITNVQAVPHGAVGATEDFAITALLDSVARQGKETSVESADLSGATISGTFDRVNFRDVTLNGAIIEEPIAFTDCIVENKGSFNKWKALLVQIEDPESLTAAAKGLGLAAHIDEIKNFKKVLKTIYRNKQSVKGAPEK